MRQNVVRAVTRWSIGSTEELNQRFLDPFDEISAYYKPGPDEAMVSLLIPSSVVFYLLIQILLRRHDRDEPEIIVGQVPAVAFTERTENRVPFHGLVSERDEYEIKLQSVCAAPCTVSLAVIVFQP